MIVFVAAFGVSALILAVCAIAGLGQSVSARVVEGVGALLCASNAAGVPFADHLTIWSLLWFIAPAAALSNVIRLRQARSLHQEQLAAIYAAEDRERQGST